MISSHNRDRLVPDVSSVGFGRNSSEPRLIPNPPQSSTKSFMPIGPPPESCFAKDQRVRVVKRDVGAIRMLHAVESCRWNPLMELCIGLVGVVSRKTPAGHYRIIFFVKAEDGTISQRKFAWHGACLASCPDYSFQQGMFVYVIDDTDLLLKENGNWMGSENRCSKLLEMTAGKTGQVWECSFGDTMVSFDGINSIGISPSCLIPVYDSRILDNMAINQQFQNSPFGDPNIRCLIPQLAGNETEPNEDQVQMFLASAKLGHEKVVMEFLYRFNKTERNSGTGARNYIDVTEQGKQTTALMHAASSGQWNMIHILCLSGADVSKRGNEAITPILYAVKGGHVMAVKILTGYGGSVRDTADGGMTALHLAAIHDNLEMFKHLVDTPDINVNAQLTETGETAFHICLRREKKDMMKYLMSKRHDINCSLLNTRHFNILSFAALHGNKDVVEFCIRKEPELVHVQRADGMSALHCAAQNGWGSIVELLITKGGTMPNVRDREGATPLHYALRQWRYNAGANAIGRLNAIYQLARSGRDLNVRGFVEEVTPLHEALVNVNHMMEVRQFFPAELVCNLQGMPPKDMQNMEALVDMCKDFPQLAAALFLLIKGASLTVTDKKGRTPADYVKQPGMQYLWAHFGRCYEEQRSTAMVKAGQSGQNPMCIKCGLTADVIFFPCGHRHCCKACAKIVSVRFCARCNSAVKKMTTTEGIVLELFVGDAADENQALRRKLEDAENKVLCIICMDRKQNMFFNCGHMVCQECGKADNLHSCPTCRKPIKKRHIVFPSW